MSSATSVRVKVGDLIQRIIAENKLTATAQISCGENSGDTEGYNAETLIVDIKDTDKSLHLFIKTPLNSEWHGNILTEKLFPNEIYFYSAIYPAYRQFLSDHRVSDGFRNVARYYGSLNNSIALDNLKRRGFKLCGTEGLLNENHVVLAMKTLAKFHAISFAYKDQKTDSYERFINGTHNCIVDIFKRAAFDKLIRVECMKFLNSLDPAEDVDLIRAGENLSEYLMDSLFTIGSEANEYSILIHGDFWSNNIMYSYENENEENPTEIMLVDWQLLRHGCPALELSYFFLSASSESMIENVDCYLKLYHDELSKRIAQLGSDPERLYPYGVFKEEWRKFCRCGFAMAFVIIRGFIVQKEEVDVLGAFYEDFWERTSATTVSNYGPRMKNEQLYFARLKSILRYFVKSNLL